jgi:hypothetical protein
MGAAEFDYIVHGFFKEADTRTLGYLSKAERRTFIAKLMIVSGKS